MAKLVLYLGRNFKKSKIEERLIKKIKVIHNEIEDLRDTGAIEEKPCNEGLDYNIRRPISESLIDQKPGKVSIIIIIISDRILSNFFPSTARMSFTHFNQNLLVLTFLNIEKVYSHLFKQIIWMEVLSRCLTPLSLNLIKEIQEPKRPLNQRINL